MTSRSARRKRYALYWCTTSDHDEDWFMVAPSAASARRAHEDAEGYGIGEARAEKVVSLPSHLVRGETWKDPVGDTWSADTAWPSDAMLIACGGVIVEREPDAAQAEMDVVCKSVTFGDRVYRAGDIVANARRPPTHSWRGGPARGGPA